MHFEDINGKTMAILSFDERTASGLPSPIDPALIDTTDVLDDLNAQEQGLEALRAADDDELTHSERASIVPKTDELRRKRPIIEQMCADYMVWQVTTALSS